MSAYFREKCRYCDAQLPASFLDLGEMALANSFISKDELGMEEFKCELSLCRCDKCGLVQLTHVVPADLMFSNYLYVSSTTATFRKHFADYASSVKEKSLKKNNLIAVDIGSNDGLLVNCFEQLGIKAVGVEPAKNLSDAANEKGVKTINHYFNDHTVELIINEYGKADIITANNVFAHIDDSQAVCKNVYSLLSDSGMFVIEFPYLPVMLEDMVFDMIYHEHLSYIAIASLQFLMNRFDMEIFHIDFVASHGGSARVFIQKKNGKYPVSPVVATTILNEKDKGYDGIKIYLEFAAKVAAVKNKLINFVSEIKSENKTIAGYGAPAKGNTLINYCGFNSNQISFIIEDNPLKQNTFTPGANIPVVSSSYLNENIPDYIVIFAWNFAREIMGKLDHLKNSGTRFIVPLPEPSII